MNKLQGKKILVTGSEGFIGSHLVERLLKEKANVTALVQYNFKNDIGNLKFLEKKYLKILKIKFGDIRDANQIKNLINSNEIILNLAALIGIPYSYNAPNSYFETNTMGLMNILNNSKGKKIIHTSTSEVYGTAKYTPIDENHSLFAQSPYAASKIAADQLAFSYYNSFQTNVTIIRPFNTFGPRQSNRAFIPTVINQLLNENSIIKLGDLSTKRDLTFVSDTVDGYIKCINCNNRKTIGKVFNLGTGFSISMKEIAEFLVLNINPNVKIIKEKRRVRPKNSEVLNLVSKNLLAKNVLGWKPEHNSKKKILKALLMTIEFYKNNLEYSNSEYVV